MADTNAHANGTNGDKHAEELAAVGRNEDGTFQKGSSAAAEAGKLGGLHSHDNDGKKETEHPDRNADGTFTKGSDEAKEGKCPSQPDCDQRWY